MEDVLGYIQQKAEEAQLRDDLCSRSTIYGLSCHFDFISDELVESTLNLAGGVGASSGSCGAYCSGQLAIGARFNPAMDEVGTEAGKEKMKIAQGKMIEFRDAFLQEFGTTLCPEIHKSLFGQSYIFTEPDQADAFFKIPDHKEKCATVVKRAARLAAEIILSEQ